MDAYGKFIPFEVNAAECVVCLSYTKIIKDQADIAILQLNFPRDAGFTLGGELIGTAGETSQESDIFRTMTYAEMAAILTEIPIKQ